VPRLPGLKPEEIASIGEIAAVLRGSFHELPNSITTLAYQPPVLKAVLALWHAVMEEGSVDKRLKWMVAHLASRAHGCMYCSAHSATGAGTSGVPPEKVEALWTFEYSPLFSDEERAALRFALAAGQSPNAVTDPIFSELRLHFAEAQVAELLAVIAIYGFFNRWNDSLATPLEPTPREFAQKHLSASGWTVGNHE
jgi:alkylhydroperoxidase family enzyme